MSANIFKNNRDSTRHKKMLRHRRENTFVKLNKAERRGWLLGPHRLLEGDESGAVGGSDTGPTVLHRLVGDGELAQVVTSHLWDNDHVPEVGLHHVGLLVGGSLLLLLPQLLDQGHGLPLESPGELPPDPADKQLHQLLVVHVEELVKVDTPVGELPESPPLLQLDVGVSHDCFS